jgi:hypothetical protein
VAGDWLALDVVSVTLQRPPLGQWYATQGFIPAYELNGRNLSVLLNPLVCDAYVEFRGVLEERSARGTLESSGMFGGIKMGSFEAEVVE